MSWLWRTFMSRDRNVRFLAGHFHQLFEVRQKVPTSWRSTSSNAAAGRAIQTAPPSPEASPDWPRSPAAAASPQRRRQHHTRVNQDAAKTTKKREASRLVADGSERRRVRLYLRLPQLHGFDPQQINVLISFAWQGAVFVLLACRRDRPWPGLFEIWWTGWKKGQ